MAENGEKKSVELKVHLLSRDMLFNLYSSRIVCLVLSSFSLLFLLWNDIILVSHKIANIKSIQSGRWTLSYEHWTIGQITHKYWIQYICVYMHWTSNIVVKTFPVDMHNCTIAQSFIQTGNFANFLLPANASIFHALHMSIQFCSRFSFGFFFIWEMHIPIRSSLMGRTYILIECDASFWFWRSIYYLTYNFYAPKAPFPLEDSR